MAAVDFFRVEPRHVDYVAEHMREADVAEVIATTGTTDMHEALETALAASNDAWTLDRLDGSGTACIFGIAPCGALLTPYAAPWLLGTPILDRYPGVLIRNTRRYLADVRERYPMLVNFVDARNTASLKYLAAVGFDIDAPVEMGADGLFFHRFHMGTPD